MLEPKDWSRLLEIALEEDHASNDVTSLLFLDYVASRQIESSEAKTSPICSFQLLAKEDLVFCGAGLLKVLQERPGWTFQSDTDEGQWICAGDRIMHGEAPFFDLLSLERSVLNILQHLSGISTRTHQAVSTVEEVWQQWSESDKEKFEKPEVLHTRKTLPGWRPYQIFACLAGGGALHRMSLSDRAMIKDNHRVFLSQLGSSFSEMKNWLQAEQKALWQEAIFEADSLQEALELEAAGAEHLLLDNFAPSDIPEAITQLHSRSIEVSGGINLANIKDYVLPGVTRISIGSLTHSVKAADISLEIVD